MSLLLLKTGSVSPGKCMGAVTCWALQCGLWTAECTACAAEEGSTQAAAEGPGVPAPSHSFLQILLLQQVQL